MKRVVALTALAFGLWTGTASAAAGGGRPFDFRHFLAAIRQAAVPEASDIDHHLFALSDANHQLIWRAGSGNQQLAVATVMTLDTYTRFYATGSGTTPSSKPVVWVTLAPQLKSWCHRFPRRAGGGAKRVVRRVIQRLGLSPRLDYSRVVELWVDRDRVFRPCPDPAASDRSCRLKMQGTPQVPGIADYPSFFASLFVSSYDRDGAPWTRLGYTYDWGGRTRFGESEYMLTTSTRYEVRSASTIPDYCR